MARNTNKGVVLSPLRYCLSCVVTLVCWALWLVLGAALAIEIYIGVAKDVPVPAFVLRRIEAQLAAENFSVRFGDAHFDPTGQILLENVQLNARAFEDSLCSSRIVHVRKSIWSVLAGRPIPDEVDFEGAMLQLPAMFSPSGTTEQLLRDVSGHVRFTANQFDIEQLSCRVGNVGVTFHGVITRPRNVHGKPLAPEEMVRKFLQYGRQVAMALPQLQEVENPTLSIEATPRPQGGTNLTMQLMAGALHHPAKAPIESGPVQIHGHWAWDGLRPHTMRLHIFAEDVAGPAGVSAPQFRALIRLEPPENEFAAIDEIEVHAEADEVQAFGERWVMPTLRGNYSARGGAGTFGVGVYSHGEHLAVNGSASLREKTANIEIEGRIPPGLVTNLLAAHGPKLEPYFRLADPVAVHAEIAVAPGWHFGGMTSFVHGGRMDSHGVQITSARGEIDVDSKLNFLAHDAELVAGENVARGSYGMNFRTLNYRMLLNGRLRPPDIGGWFRGDWWGKFWSHFDFPAQPPTADVDVQGCWRDVTQTTYFGSTDAFKPVVLGAAFERARTHIFARPQFAHVIDLAVETAGGTQHAGGWFKRESDEPGKKAEITRYDYDLAGNLDASMYAQMAGDTAARYLANFHFDHPPQVHVSGSSVVDQGQIVSELGFNGDSNGSLQVYGIPLDHLAIDAGVKGTEANLHRVDFQFAGGHGSGKATLGLAPDDHRLSFEATLKEADFARTVRAVQDFAALHSTTPPTKDSDAESKFMKRASNGKLDVTVSAQGSPPDVASFRGGGTARLTGAELGEIHLFGLLSRALSAVAVNFGSLKLNEARTSFQLSDGRIHFPDARISGPSAVIEAKGDYIFAGKSLDFTAHLKPYEEGHNPLGILMNPLTSIFELKLSGPIAKPSWSVALGQSPKPEGSAAPAAATPEPEKKPAPPEGPGT
ncbi:MAG TPA: AsmA-like C-terminal region-containing protein [Candidatus Didemnitutus sp.]|nr:AsmA-like C-terminal region-containing protein [Candidatus Didemnitutus sp.]